MPVSDPSLQDRMENGHRGQSGMIELSLLGFVNTALRHRVLVAATALIFAGGTALLVVVSARTYTSTSVLVPQTESMRGSLAGLATQFGFSLPGDSPSESPEFYAALLKSREILSQAVTSTYAVTNGAEMNLVEYYEIDRGPELLRRDKAIDKLSGDMNVVTMRSTGMIHLSVRAEHGEMARMVNARLLELLNEFNLERRRSKASAERSFAESRLSAVHDTLTAVENELAVFLASNRDFQNSPTLRFQHDRLTREVGHQQQLYTALVQMYEQAKLDEVRNTPVLTVVQFPETPTRPDRRGLMVRTVLAFLIGALSAMIVAAWHQATSRQETESPLVHEFHELRQDLWRDLTRPWRRFRQRADRVR